MAEKKEMVLRSSISIEDVERAQKEGSQEFLKWLAAETKRVRASWERAWRTGSLEEVDG